MSTQTLDVLTPDGADARIERYPLDRQQKVQRALRHWHVAATRADTAAVDVFFGPSDSLGEGAFAAKFDEMYENVFRDRVRAALQPAGVRGGRGYWGFGSNLALPESPFFGATGPAITQTNLVGLGRKAWVFPAGSTFVAVLRKTTSFQVVYSTQTEAGGSFNTLLTTLGGTPGTTSASVVTTAASVTHGNRSPLFTCGEEDQYLSITNNGTVPITLEGLMMYNGDDPTTNKGIRTWEAARSGYNAQTFVDVPAWADSIAAVPNIRLAVIGIGSNDWYAGRTSAQAKADIQTIIALMRAKVGHSDFSIVLLSYYTREATPHPAAVEPWSAFQAMYRELEEEDDDIAVLDIEPLFGIQQSATDTLDGLLYTDYVHPTSAGFLRIGAAIADFVIPEGGEGAGPSALNSVPIVVQNAIETSRAGIHYAAATVGGGTLNFGAFTWGVPGGAFPLMDAVGHYTITGSIGYSTATLPVTGTRPGHFYQDVVQDATGGRNVAFTGFKYRNGAAPVIDVAPNARTMLHFYFDGLQWWVDGGHSSSLVATSIGVFAGGTAAFSTLPLGSYNTTSLTGNTTLAPSGMPFGSGPGRTARWSWTVTQDATGGRTLTLDAAILGVNPGPLLNPLPSTTTRVEFFWDGLRWWAWSSFQPAGDLALSLPFTGLTGALNLATFTSMQNARLTLAGNVTLGTSGMPAVPAGYSRTLRVTYIQDATGGRTLTHTGFKRPGGALALSAGANAQDVVEYYWDGASWWAYLVATNGS